MLTKSRKLDVLFLSIILVVAGFYVGTNYASSFSGVTKTLGDDFIEVESANATYYYLDDTNITDRLGGDWEVGLTAPYFNNTSGVYFNSGSTINCYNGTWIPHGLSGDPSTTGSITLSLRGASEYNATFIYRVPTVLSSNDTHFQVEFSAWETGGWTLVPVTVVEAATIYWDGVYEGMNFPLGVGNPFDQTLNVADDATFNSVDVSEIYYNDVDVTDIFAYPEDSYTFLVWVDGSTYRCKHTNGTEVYSGTDADTVINYALGHLTSGRTWDEKVLLVGYFDINDPIDLDSGGNNTILELIGTVHLNSAADGENMVEFNGENGLMYGTGIRIIGGLWDGNRAGITGESNGIYWNQSVQVSGRMVNRFIDMSLIDFERDGFHIDSRESSNSQFYWQNIFVTQCQYGMYAIGLYDFWIDSGLWAGDQYAIHLEDSGAGDISGVHTNYGFKFETCTFVQVEGGYHDSIANKPLIDLFGARYCKFSNMILRATGSNANTDQDAISIDSDGATHSIYNSFNDIGIGRLHLSGTNRWQNLIEEVDANQNHNTYNDIRALEVGDYASGRAFVINGPDSKMRSIYVPFTVVNAATAGLYGYDLDADGETVLAFTSLPMDYTEIIRVKIDARTDDTDNDGGMNANITISGGAEDAAWDEHSFALTEHASTLTITAGDIIYWEVDVADSSTLLDFDPEDSMSFYVEYCPASGVHSATDADFRGVLIEFI